jgi:AraC family transcriptional regulator, dual regulator of chb operon
MLIDYLNYRQIANESPYHAARQSSELLSPNALFHTHDFDEVFLVTSGTLKHDINGETQTLIQNDLVLVEARDIHRFRHDHKAPFEFINIAFPFQNLNELLRLMQLSSTVKRTNLSSSKRVSLQRNFELLTAEFSYQPQQTTLIPFLSTVVATLNKLKEIEDRLDNIDRAIQNIEKIENLHLGMDYLVQTASVSMSHLCRVVKKRTGKSPGEIIQSARLRHVRILLVTTNLDVATIAEQVGYTSSHYLHRVFKNEFGQTPGDFRKSQRAVVSS